MVMLFIWKFYSVKMSEKPDEEVDNIKRYHIFIKVLILYENLICECFFNLSKNNSQYINVNNFVDLF